MQTKYNPNRTPFSPGARERQALVSVRHFHSQLHLKHWSPTTIKTNAFLNAVRHQQHHQRLLLPSSTALHQLNN